MRSKFLPLYLTVALAVAFASGCTPKKKTEEGTPENNSAATSSPATSEDINSGNADSDSGKADGLETVHYAYDSASLDETAKNTLRSNARVLKDKGSLKIQIEGHTDERGGIQYNIALGERRANATKAFLADQGVSSERMTVISYGKEKPIDPSHDESAWSKNRRANFRITER